MTSLSTNDFRWIHTEGWNNQYKEYVAQIYRKSTGQIFSRKFYQSGKKHRRPQSIGGWLLIFTGEETPRAYAEAIVDPRKFNQLDIRLFSDEEPCHEHLQDALEFFISGLMIAAKADVLHIFASNMTLLNGFTGEAFITKTALSPNAREFFAEMDHEPFIRSTFVEVDPSLWWQDARGKELKAKLKFLELRLKPKQPFSRPKRPRGLFSRLLGRR